MEASAVCVGAVVGAVSRWHLTALSHNYNISPWGTAMINVSGSFVLGSLVSYNKIKVIDRPTMLLVGTGFCG
jgi:CrcB protein